MFPCFIMTKVAVQMAAKHIKCIERKINAFTASKNWKLSYLLTAKINIIGLCINNPRPTKGVTMTPSDFFPVALKRRKIAQKASS